MKISSWESEYVGRAPDIGAYENGNILSGPPFGFDGSVYQEHPRIVQTKVEKYFTFFFSLPIRSVDIKPVFLNLFNDEKKAIKRTATLNKLICELPEKISAKSIRSISLPHDIRGKNGLPITLWAANSQDHELHLY